MRARESLQSLCQASRLASPIIAFSKSYIGSNRWTSMSRAIGPHRASTRNMRLAKPQWGVRAAYPDRGSGKREEISNAELPPFHRGGEYEKASALYGWRAEPVAGHGIGTGAEYDCGKRPV